MIVRIGVLSDLHCELEPTGSRWINDFEPERLDERLDAALAWFAEARVDLILLLGDIVQFANQADLEHAFSRLAASEVAPLATVGGNHDLRLGDEFAERAREYGIRLLHEEPLDLAGVRVSGVAVARGAAPPQYVGQHADGGGDGALVVVASHFPILSEASRLAAAGLPYPGDLVNRAELEVTAAERFAAEARPERAHPLPHLDPCRAAAAAHGRRRDRAALRRDDRRDRSRRPRRQADRPAPRRGRRDRSRLRRGRGALAESRRPLGSGLGGFGEIAAWLRDAMA